MKTKNSHIGDQLRQFVNNLSTDAWGIESKVKEGIIQFFGKVAADEKLSFENLNLLIRHNVDRVEIMQCYQGQILRALDIKDLSMLFGVSSLLIHPEKTARHLTAYLKHLSNVNNVELGHLNIHLLVSGKEPILLAYHSQRLIANLQISDLIKYFRS